MQIHDELIYEVGHPDGEINSQQEAFVRMLHGCMEREIVQVLLVLTQIYARHIRSHTLSYIFYYIIKHPLSHPLTQFLSTITLQL